MSRASAGRLTMRAEDLREPVLERVVAALAARVDLPLDRLSDAQLASSVLIRGANRHAVDGVVRVELDVEDGAVGLSVGPLPAGGGSRMVAEDVPGVGPGPGAPGGRLERRADRRLHRDAAPQHRRRGRVGLARAGRAHPRVVPPCSSTTWRNRP